MLKTFRNTNPKNFELLKTTTFISQTSHYVPHRKSVIPNTTRMVATINRINPVGQKQEAASPRPNATAHFAVEQLFLCHIQLTAVIKNKTVFLLSYHSIFNGRIFGSLTKAKKQEHFRCEQ